MRRVLNFTRSEWDALPEWEKRMYLDELLSHIQGRGSADDPGEGGDDAYPVGIRTRTVQQ